MKKIQYFIVFIIFLIIIFNSQNIYAAEGDVYDVILFWGQSNMVGSAGYKTGEDKKDTRVDEDKNFSKYSGIKQEIIDSYESYKYTRVDLDTATAYEFMYDSNKFRRLNSNITRLGEFLKYEKDTGNLILTDSSTYSLQKSYGTNMIPQFCKTYYENTGRKVAAVLCANGGEKISNFLPLTDSEYGDTKNQYIYEATVKKYNAAVKYLEDNNFEIGCKLYVVFQGESDVSGKTGTDKYKKRFLKVHNNIKNDLGITKGAIVQTSYTIGKEGYYEDVEKIHKAQEELINENADIICGSTYSYDRYIPDKDTYEKEDYINNIFTDKNGEKLDFDTAKKYAEYSVCAPTNNAIHFTSAALAQIGDDVANSFSRVTKIEIKTKPKKLKYILGYEELDLEGGTITVTFESGATRQISMTEAEVKVSGFSNEIVGNKSITVEYKGIKTKFSVTIEEVKLSDLTIEEIPNNIEYVEGQKFDKTGMKVIAHYNNKTTKELLTEYTINPERVLTIEDSKVTMSYTENGITKTVEQTINVIKKGDVNKDNTVDFTDILAINKHRLGKALLTGACLEASDVNDDGNIDFMDILQINKFRLGKIYSL